VIRQAVRVRKWVSDQMNLRFLVGAVLVVFAVTLAVAANTLLGPGRDGPLSTQSRVSFTSPPLAVGQAFSWSSYLPGNPTAADIRIEAIEPVGVRGLEVLGVVLGYPELRPDDGYCLAPGMEPGFPPTHSLKSEPREVKGSTLPTKDKWTCGNHPSAIVGVRLLPDSAGGAIDALRVLYWHNGALYEVVMPYSLKIPRRGSDAT